MVIIYLMEIIKKYDSRGGSLCLDFVNTVFARNKISTSSGPLWLIEQDYLTSYRDLLEFSRQLKTISQAQFEYLEELSESMPDQSQLSFNKAFQLRESLFLILIETIQSAPPGESEIRFINQLLQELPKQQLRPLIGERGLVFKFSTDSERPNLDWPIYAVLRSMSELLTTCDLQKVRICSGERCGWLFLDTSKNHTRRWCSMQDCGNRAKAKRFYNKQKD